MNELRQDPGRLNRGADASASTFAVHLLDVGPEEYGDAIVCQFGDTTVLIDGAHPGNYKDKGEDHPSIQAQIGDVMGQQEEPYSISLLICTHAHADHIGCLPALVEQNSIRPEWALVADPRLGWGHTADDRTSDALLAAPAGVRVLVAALREETLADASDEQIAVLADAAATLEQRYNRMLQQLAERGTRVVRYGSDDPQELLRRFQEIGLEILGPSQDQLEHCAKLIAGRSQDLMHASTALLPGDQDSQVGVITAYRQVVDAVKAGADNADAFSKEKGAINDQSLVTVFTYQGVHLLFTGDMQFADPQVSDDLVSREIDTLLDDLAARAPYALVKLAHHGSDNGFSESVWDKLGRPRVIGMCAGSGSKHHPNPQTLRVLDSHAKQIRWARTDHNGRVTFRFSTKKPAIELTRGELNDPEPNSSDEPAPEPAGAPEPSSRGLESPTRPAGVAGPGGGGRPATGGDGDTVELITRVPAGVRITFSGAFTFEVAGAASSTREHDQEGVPRIDLERAARPEPSALALASGRTLPPLLFVTSRQALISNIGAREADAVLDALRVARQDVLETLPRGLWSQIDAVSAVRAELAAKPYLQGVVLLGGYDTIPPQCVDALPPRLRRQLPSNDDADNFLVWSDDAYGDRDGNGIPDLPVSRIPDGKASELVFAALQAPLAQTNEHRHGLRNVARPFADLIYSSLPGGAQMLRSGPVLYNQSPKYSLDAERVYLMLHGNDVIASLFWGEDAGQYPTAMHLENVPVRPGSVVFTGCCWGALAADTSARRAVPSRRLGDRTADTSIALRFLANGARAFVGCTGSHYSPTLEPYGYFGEPLHRAFWQAYAASKPPAAALLDAKLAFMDGMPHGRIPGSLAEAIEFKIWREYTCLGLGW